jgi:hypothetical protein
VTVSCGQLKLVHILSPLLKISTVRTYVARLYVSPSGITNTQGSYADLHGTNKQRFSPFLVVITQSAATLPLTKYPLPLCKSCIPEEALATYTRLSPPAESKSKRLR